MTFTEREYFYIGLITIGLACVVVSWVFALFLKKKTSKWLFGTDNIRFYTKELIKMYFNGEGISVFSKKRIESGFAFLVMQWGLIHWLILNITTMGWVGIVAWASVEGAICGYVIKKIEESKPTNV